MNRVLFYLPLIFVSCSEINQPWKFDAIATQNKVFDSSRITYFDPINSPLHFEIIHSDTGLNAFISLTKYQFRTSEEGYLHIDFEIDGMKYEDSLPLLEGGMRLCLSQDRTQALINSLCNGKKVTILVDGFEQSITPNQFKNLYAKMNRPNKSFHGFIKGLF